MKANPPYLATRYLEGAWSAAAPPRQLGCWALLEGRSLLASGVRGFCDPSPEGEALLTLRGPRTRRLLPSPPDWLTWRLRLRRPPTCGLARAILPCPPGGPRLSGVPATPTPTPSTARPPTQPEAPLPRRFALSLVDREPLPAAGPLWRGDGDGPSPPRCPLPPPPPSRSPVRSPSPSRPPTLGLTRALPIPRPPGRYLEGAGRGRTIRRWAPNPRARLGVEAGIPLDGAPGNPPPAPPTTIAGSGDLRAGVVCRPARHPPPAREVRPLHDGGSDATSW